MDARTKTCEPAPVDELAAEQAETTPAKSDRLLASLTLIAGIGSSSRFLLRLGQAPNSSCP